MRGDWRLTDVLARSNNTGGGVSAHGLSAELRRVTEAAVVIWWQRPRVLMPVQQISDEGGFG
ncbi:hypothetical protein HanPI659440_Chr06g0236231 [Helianthus annuus]|uniref:Uncharacterized protein n=1 Tax=Helianthus annuus TaxID=4232 RepID=A0A251UIW7_HELAN|nr:hypothetical protein HanXRQr2_Chr06g0259461 [Helianthus annuus]KAJ0566938.1 hypothetical protein HanIR_Chr06g0279141 [Helianthus annuus]KAJ0780316.1 hypothetical protein HanPI659440_Chr06g0236231 [Helianthus annuus]KAJ0915496.1 hypothetical protein HanPSC8_Chr06g0250461 [Helianthus annuus]